MKQPLQLSVALDLLLRRLHPIGGNDLSHRLPVHRAGQRPARSVSTITLAGAMAGGLAALTVASEERAGTELFNRGDLAYQCGALLAHPQDCFSLTAEGAVLKSTRSF